MRHTIAVFILVCAVAAMNRPSYAQSKDDLISPSRPVPTGKAPSMQVKQIKDTPEEKVYAVIFLSRRRSSKRPDRLCNSEQNRGCSLHCNRRDQWCDTRVA
jgi:hypothetical protein